MNKVNQIRNQVGYLSQLKITTILYVAISFGYIGNAMLWIGLYHESRRADRAEQIIERLTQHVQEHSSIGISDIQLLKDIGK